MAKYIDLVSGVFTQIQPATAGGSSSANQIPQLDGNGRLDITMMPSGVGPGTFTATAGEALAAGNLVYLSSTDGKVYKADATSPAKFARGHVKQAFAANATATVYVDGEVALSGLTPGAEYYLSTTAGNVTNTPPSGSGQIVQRVGFAVSASALQFFPYPAVELA